MSPRKEFDLQNYDTEIMRQMAGIAYEADVFRFDGSDQMPGAVGSNSFWKQATAWLAGQDTKTTLDKIEATWPKS